MTVRFDAIGLIVSNMAETLAFYRMLGVEIPRQADGESHVEAQLADGMRIMWDTAEVVRSFSHWEPPTGGHRISLAFLCDAPAEVDSRYAEMIAVGHRSHVAPFNAFWGQRYATVLDPDDNPVDLFARLEEQDQGSAE